VVGRWKGFCIVSRIVGLRAKARGVLTCGGMTGKESDPVEKTGQEKLDIPQACIGESIPSRSRRFVAARHAGWQRKAASHCACYSLIAVGRLCQDLI
jgi:hypothetical protein